MHCNQTTAFFNIGLQIQINLPDLPVVEITRFRSETNQFFPGSVFFQGARRECWTAVAAAPKNFSVKVSMSRSNQEVGGLKNWNPGTSLSQIIPRNPMVQNRIAKSSGKSWSIMVNHITQVIYGIETLFADNSQFPREPLQSHHCKSGGFQDPCLFATVCTIENLTMCFIET